MREHKHAALIEQMARDARKTDRPQHWWEVKSDEEWMGFKGDDYLPCFREQSEYRRIPQWVIDGLEVGDYLKDKLTGDICKIAGFRNYTYKTSLECYLIDIGIYVDPIVGALVFAKYEKYTPPRTININGFEVPEPLKSLKEDEPFFYVSFGGRIVFSEFTERSDKHSYLLGMGFCHYTKEAAEMHSQALNDLEKRNERA